jgi:hypothetical protein
LQNGQIELKLSAMAPFAQNGDKNGASGYPLVPITMHPMTSIVIANHANSSHRWRHLNGAKKWRYGGQIRQ